MSLFARCFARIAMNRTLRALPFLAVLALPLASPVAHADAAACQPVIAAMARVAGIPSHQYMTRTLPGMGSKQSEVVITASAMWILVDGRWKSIPYDGQRQVAEMKRKYAEAVASGSVSCARAADEAAGGEPAAVYTLHQTTEAGTTDTRVWISTSRGLPMRQVIDIPELKARTDSRFDYANVQPPTGAH
jgi:hypothetical protein